VQDLGVAVKGQGIYALVAHPTSGLVYGLTYPDGEVFSFEAKTGVFKNRGRVSKAKMPGEKFENEKNIGRALAVGKDGNVYTSGDGNFCQVGLGEVKELTLSVPTVPGREVYSRVDAWAQDEAGNLYGGSSDGYLFRFDTEHMRVQNLGKPLSQYRIRGLVASPNGKLYGIGGDNDDMARLFSYDPSTGAYDVLGMIDVNRRPYYSWQGYVFDSMAIGKDGTVYMGQAERKSKLYLFYPN
jgi:outer membrane protein assembly factor BamB